MLNVLFNIVAIPCVGIILGAAFGLYMQYLKEQENTGGFSSDRGLEPLPRMGTAAVAGAILGFSCAVPIDAVYLIIKILSLFG